MVWPITLSQDKCAQDVLASSDTNETLNLLVEMGYKQYGGPWAHKYWWWRWGHS